MASFLFLLYSQDKTGNSLSVKQAMAIKKSNQERNRVTAFNRFTRFNCRCRCGSSSLRTLSIS